MSVWSAVNAYSTVPGFSSLVSDVRNDQLSFWQTQTWAESSEYQEFTTATAATEVPSNLIVPFFEAGIAYVQKMVEYAERKSYMPEETQRRLVEDYKRQLENQRRFASQKVEAARETGVSSGADAETSEGAAESSEPSATAAGPEATGEAEKTDEDGDADNDGSRLSVTGSVAVILVSGLVAVAAL